MLNCKKIKIMLLERDENAKDLAKAIGVSEATLSKNLRNVTKPSLETVVKIAIHLGVDIMDICEVPDEDTVH